MNCYYVYIMQRYQEDRPLPLWYELPAPQSTWCVHVDDKNVITTHSKNVAQNVAQYHVHMLYRAYAHIGKIICDTANKYWLIPYNSISSHSTLIHQICISHF